MPRADLYMSGLFVPNASKIIVRSKVLTPIEAASLSSGLRSDAADLYYSGWISLLDALHGIQKGFYTCATVKLYYTVFYVFRASLAVDEVCAFHVEKSSFMLLAQAGESPVSCTEQGTHKTVMKAFERQNPGHPLLSQQIDLVDAVDWLVEKRESANYRDVRFIEPNYQPALKFVAENGLRRSLNAYLSEASTLYVFDPDHALIAYPLRALQLIGNQLAGAGAIQVSEAEQDFLKTRTRDQSGNLPALLSEMKRLNLLTAR